MKQRKILFLTTCLGGGGAEMHLLRVANHLDRARFQPLIVTSRRGGSYEDQLAPDVEHIALGGHRKGGLGRRVAALARFGSLLRKQRPDAIVSALAGPDIFVMLGRRAGLTRAPHVLCVQAPPSMVPFRSPRVAIPLVRSAFRQATRIVSISEGVVEDIQRFAPGLGERVSVIYNACVEQSVRERAIQKPDVERPAGRLLLVACGRLAEQKGFEYLIDAMDRVRNVVPAALLWILGTGPLENALKARIAQLDLGQHVKLLGFKSNPFAYMAAADVFVLSSVFEGLGMVLVEAMACGTPVVSTDCPYGPAEVLSGECGGVLVPTRDPARLASAIEALLRDDARRERLGQAARRRAEDFDSTTIAGQYGQLLDDVLNASPASQSKSVGSPAPA